MLKICFKKWSNLTKNDQNGFFPSFFKILLKISTKMLKMIFMDLIRKITFCSNIYHNQLNRKMGNENARKCY